MRTYVWGCAYICVRLHVYTCKLMHTFRVSNISGSRHANRHRICPYGLPKYRKISSTCTELNIRAGRYNPESAKAR